MPAVVAFGRRWACGTDDFVFPGILDTTVKSCWLVSALLAYFQMKVDDYENRNKFVIYLVGMMASLLIIIMTDLFAVNRSAKGSITDTHLRTIIPTLIYIRLFWEAVDTGWNTLGTIWVFGPMFAPVQIHDPSSFYFTRRYVICNWISLIILALFFAFLYDPLGGIKRKEQENFQQAQTQFWAKKLRMYASIFYKARSHTENEAQLFQIIGRNFSNILGETNFVSSDVIAGLFLLYRLEEDGQHQGVSNFEPIEDKESYTLKKFDHAETDEISRKSDAIEPKISPDFLKLLEFEKYFPFTSGSHSWAKQMDSQHVHCFSKIKSCICFAQKSSCDSQFEANGFCRRCKMSGLVSAITAAGISKSDLVHVSCASGYDEAPFCMFVDNSSKSIILVVLPGQTIVSFTDTTQVPLVAQGIPSNYKVHGGLYKVSEKLKLRSLSVLEQLAKTYPTYNLVIIGHSFGAGVGSLLGFSLFARFPGLQVICLNPPGGLLSIDAAKFSETFITSITYGNDLFARINSVSMSKLRRRVINAMYNAETPKYKLLLGVLLRFLGFKLNVKISSKSVHELQQIGYVNKGLSVTDLTVESGETDLGSETVSVEKTNYMSPETAKDTDSNKMCLTGRIIYIHQPKTKNQRRPDESEKNYDTIEILDAQSNMFFEILTKPGILDDHYNSQDRILEALKKQKACSFPKIH